ncbi:MAG: hypothetical protein K2K80_08170 [Clostridia bacterium]|nr:hypothetical protein [Clostridia bacterium]
MKVKDIVVRALFFAGRDDVANIVESKGQHTSESTEVLKTMLYCFNAVQDELARNYFSLITVEKMSATSGIFYFEDFTLNPVRIISVKANGADVRYTLYPKSIVCDARSVEITYEYSPDKLGLDGECAFTENQASIKMLAAGAASEYCLINGEVSQAEALENIYRQEIDKIRRNKLSAVKFPPRRWV